MIRAKKAVKKKAAPKKKAAKPVSKVPKSSTILAELEKQGYSIDEDSEQDEDFSDGDVTKRTFDVVDRDGDSIVKIDISEGNLRHCCGVIEVGGLEIGKTWLYEDNQKVNDKVLIAVLGYIFLYLREKNIPPTTKRNLPAPFIRPVIFTSNGVEDCAIFEVAATKYLKNAYKVVSTTVNPGSDRTIKIYMSFS